jgi:hypothetical protein
MNLTDSTARARNFPSSIHTYPTSSSYQYNSIDIALMHLPPRLSLDSTILSSPLYRRSSYRNTSESSATTTDPASTNSNPGTQVDSNTQYQTINMSSSSSSSSHSMVREKSTPPTSPLLRGRSPYQRDELQSKMAERGRSKTKRSRTLGRVAILLIVVIILVFVGRDRVCGYVPNSMTKGVWF